MICYVRNVQRLGEKAYQVILQQYIELYTLSSLYCIKKHKTFYIEDVAG